MTREEAERCKDCQLPRPVPWPAIIVLCLAIVGPALVTWSTVQGHEIRLTAINEWRATTDGSRFTASDAAIMQGQFRSEMQIMRTELEAEIRANRAFIRSLCNRIDALQLAAGQPVTDDCARP